MANDDEASSSTGAAPTHEPRDKNLQVKVTATYQAAVQVLATAKGHKTISDYIGSLLDAEIAAAQLDELDNAIDERKAREANDEKASLREVFSKAGPLKAVG
ncbi:hypothetical protein QN239_32270 [Mycolicibacterium sp. Y3]